MISFRFTIFIIINIIFFINFSSIFFFLYIFFLWLFSESILKFIFIPNIIIRDFNFFFLDNFFNCNLFFFRLLLIFFFNFRRNNCLSLFYFYSSITIRIFWLKFFIIFIRINIVIFFTSMGVSFF